MSFVSALVDRLRDVCDEALDALYPPACFLCAAPVGSDGLGCVRHRLPVRPEGPRCGRCAAALAPAVADGALCPDCRRAPPPWSRVIVLGDYRDEALRAWILALKHGGRSDLARPLGAVLARRQREVAEGGVLVPVPLHPLRRLERGYDQARLLAEAAARCGGGRSEAVLRRPRWTGPQGSPGTASRRANVRGAFVLAVPADRVCGRDVWVVDDVVTSGATAAECARALRRAGARRVGVLALARAAAETRSRVARRGPLVDTRGE